jgi:hypothetical protein
MRRVPPGLALVGVLWSAAVASAQVTSSPGATTADEPPSIRLGVEIFPDFTYQVDPTVIDAGNNSVHLSQFGASRARINVVGNLSDLISFRLTPDIGRETSVFSDLTGSLEFRLTYAYLQLNLDRWMPEDSYARFGFQQTPWLEYAESIYRYRFQGSMFPERDGYLVVADAGASFHATLPSEYGDVHVGVYNGEGSNREEVSGNKSIQVRGTLRPFANPSAPAALSGIRATVFYDADQYLKDAPRNRFLANVTFEYRYLHAGVEFLDATDRLLITRPEVHGRGYSVWATPRTSRGFEALVRYDHLMPNTSLSARVQSRTIAGVAYWFPVQGSVASALMVDYDGARFENFVPVQPRQTKVAVHGLIAF